LAGRAPEIVDFLRMWGMDATVQIEAETYLAEHSIEDTAVWYLRNKESLWTQWVPADVAQRVRQALDVS